MSEKKDVLILAIESSCDETAAAVVKNGREVLSNIISSQIDLHTLYGGVVPEIASRKHIEKINQVIETALMEAHATLADIDAIGVTYGPGLVGALLVGVAEAKAIAYAAKKPLVGVHHIEGPVSYTHLGKASWSKFKRAVARKRIIILYTAEKQAIVLPIDQMGDQYTAVVDLIYANMPAPAVRIRRMDGKK